jgi:tetratricopeptide (TPR) repeat protein
MLRAGHVHQDLGELDDAIQHYDTALQIIRKREGHSDTAELTREEDVMAQALPLPVSERATREDKVIDQASLAAEAECLSHLATAYRLTGDLPKALVCSQGAKEYYEILDNTLKKATIEHEQGLILKLMERSESALERFVASLRLCRELGDPKCVAENLLEIGQLFDKLGKTDVAIHVIEDAIERHSYLRNPEHGALLSLLESLYDKQRRLTEAITRFRTTREKSRTEH